MSQGWGWLIAKRAEKIHKSAMVRLWEIGDAHGCEASSQAAFEHGRLAVLEELGLSSRLATMTEPESTEATEASADEAEATSDDDATEADESSVE